MIHFLLPRILLCGVLLYVYLCYCGRSSSLPPHCQLWLVYLHSYRACTLRRADLTIKFAPHIFSFNYEASIKPRKIYSSRGTSKNTAEHLRRMLPTEVYLL